MAGLVGSEMCIRDSITIDTVTRRPISVTRKPNFKWSIKFVRRSGSQFT